MGFLTLFFAILFLELIFLGLIGSLTLNSLLLCNFCFGFIACAYLYFKKTPMRWEVSQKTNPKLLRGLALSFMILIPASVILLRHFYALYQIPLEYDNLAYHLPIVVEWLKLGHMREIFYSPFAGPLGYYPSNFELLDLWTFLLWKGDLLVNHINLPLSAFLAFALFQMGRAWNFKSTESALLILLFFSLPVVFHQVGTPQVDLFFCLTFVLSCYFLNEYSKNKSLSELFLFALASGLFLGTKYLAVPYFAPLLTLAVILTFNENFKTKHRGKIAWGALLVACGALLGGGYWYVRNWILAGNPIFPAEVSLGSFTLFQGYYGYTDKIFGLSLLENVKSWETLYSFIKTYTSMTGLSLFAMLLLPCIYFLSLLPKWKQIRRANKTFLLLITGMILYFFLYWKAPYTFKDLIPNVRYSFMFLILGIFIIGWISSRMKFLRYFILPALVLSSIANFKFFILEKYNPDAHVTINENILIGLPLEDHHKLIFLFFVILVVSTIFSIYAFHKNARRIGASIGVLVFLGSTWLLSLTQFERENIHSIFYPTWEQSGNPTRILWKVFEVDDWLSNNIPNANLAYAGFHSPYPLYGRDQSRIASYVNINECTSCRYIDYKNSADSIRRDPNETNWISNLSILNKNVLVLYLGDFYGSIYSYENDFVQNHPERFELIYSLEDFLVYAIKTP